MQDLKLFAIGGKVENLMNKVDSSLQQVEKDTKQDLDFAGLDAILGDGKRKTNLVFVGQYSAGKSSIIKMLTGDKDIQIGAAITTQNSTPYDWKGLKITDTPGIATGYREDHDEITYKAIANADLIVYVVTNEGFNPRLVDNFKKIAFNVSSDKVNVQQGVGKFNEMILVVNKMSRMGNTPDNHKILIDDIKKAMAPENIDGLKVCFLDAQDYLDSLQETDLEIKQELVKRSGYATFIQVLDNFANEKQLVGRLITPVQQMEAVLQTNISKIKGSTGDVNLDYVDNSLKGQIDDLYMSRNRGERELKEIFRRYALEIRACGRELSSVLGDKDSDYNQKESEIKGQLGSISSQCQQEVEAKFVELSNTIRANASTAINDECLKQIAKSLPEGQQNSELLKGIVKEIGNIKIDPDILKLVLHKLGYKFKPWEFFKYTKLAAKINKALPVIGQIIGVLFETWEKKKQEDAIRELNNAKREIVTSFNEMADEFERNGLCLIQDSFVAEINKTIEHVEGELKKIDQQRKNKSKSVVELENLVAECRTLVREIRIEVGSNE